MTVEEAIEILNKGYTPRGDRESFKRYFLARGMAIRSLEAWEKVREEIEKYRIIGDGIYDGTVDFALEIIDKHLQEVENA